MRKTLINALLWAICLALLLVGITSANGGVEPKQNCWDQHQTEEEAILNCENHDGN